MPYNSSLKKKRCVINRSLNMEKIAFIANFAVLEKGLSYGQLLYEIYKKEKEYL